MPRFDMVGRRAPARSFAWVLGIALALLAPRAAGADADEVRALDIAHLRGGVSLTPYLSAFRDPDGKSDIDQMLSTELDPDVSVSPRGDPSFGFTSDVVWLRFAADNASDQPHPFLLELGYPLLDHVTLYTIHEDGRREQRVTGDMLPFAQRDLEHPNFVFRLSLPPRSSASYYLRLQTEGVLKAPLTAWDPADFVVGQQSLNAILWMFYGALAVLALYNLTVFVMLRQSEYLAYVFLASPLGAIAFTFNGHTFQYLMPNHPIWVNRALPVSLALVLVGIGVFAHMVLRRVPECERYATQMAWWIPPSLALALFSCFGDPAFALRVVLGALALGASVGTVQLVFVARRKNPLVRLYVLSWAGLLIALPVQFMRYVNLLPSSFFTDWALHIGFLSHGVMTSLALASRISIMRDQLARNVSELSTALTRAEKASDEARRATLAKDEFMATMSHELRTPLNAIVNVPQGLLEEFADKPGARCGACSALFLLDPGERVDAAMPCGACGAVGTLAAKTHTLYLGDAARTMQHLRRIERSGRHLLQMVNGVLDFSKIDAGHLVLQPRETDLGALLRESIDELGDPAVKKQLRIVLEAPAPAHAQLSVVDPMRVKQIVLNLLSNAVKFTDPARAVTVRFRPLPEADVVEVEDQGIGIDAADHERVFQRFEQVHGGDARKYGGTGLGLPISRSLARMHGGDLTVSSTPGVGSTFTLTLPRRALEHDASQSDAAE